MSDQVTLYVRAGDPTCEAAIRYLTQRGVEHRVRDLTTDPAVSAILLRRLGRIAVPAFQIGDRFIVGFDPVQLSRYLPRADEGEGARVSFGAGVRSLTPAIAREHGLPAAFGVEVGPVREGSPAARAGIRPGDVITAIGPYTLTGGEAQFRTAVAARRPGDSMSISVWREGRTDDVQVLFPDPEPAAGEAPPAGSETAQPA